MPDSVDTPAPPKKTMRLLSVQSDGKCYFDGTVFEAAEVLQALGVDAIGVNCSTGPDQLESVVRAQHEMTDLPIVAKPNAGMPKILETGEAVYSMQADTFAAHMGQLVEAGASLIGSLIVERIAYQIAAAIQNESAGKNRRRCSICEAV